ncbi:hypothetical protein [Rossellomorea marisflavi]|uniref:hypothetical protein n=1 Tax=Rossellomorea marisflavi TaxID=189381 RepID=UPI001EE34766|nr:hypothetical protein [Rossellomorea marisflavi]UKS66447.1 hypothetical protein K6T23_06240 [Rossellomorea marisflavi]
MNMMKESIWLARFDFKYVLKHIPIVLLMAALYAYFFAELMEGYLVKAKPAFDLFFFLYIFFMPAWSRTKDSLAQKINGDLYAAPVFLLLNQLPIKKTVIITSRLLCLYIPITIGTAAVMVMTYYWSEDLKGVLTFGEMLVLTSFWTGIALSFCSASVTMEMGERISKKRIITSFIWLLAGAAALFYLMKYVLQTGILKWSIYFSADYPVLMILMAILIPTLSTWWAYRHALKQMNKMDYM